MEKTKNRRHPSIAHHQLINQLASPRKSRPFLCKAREKIARSPQLPHRHGPSRAFQRRFHRHPATSCSAGIGKRDETRDGNGEVFYLAGLLSRGEVSSAIAYALNPALRSGFNHRFHFFRPAHQGMKQALKGLAEFLPGTPIQAKALQNR